MLRVVSVSNPQVGVEVAGALERFTTSSPSVATRDWTVEGPYTVRVARAVPPVIFLAFGLGKIILGTPRALPICLLQNLMVPKMVLQGLLSGKPGFTVFLWAENVLWHPTGCEV